MMSGKAVVVVLLLALSGAFVFGIAAERAVKGKEEFNCPKYPPCSQLSQSDVIHGPNGPEVYTVFVCQTATGHKLFGEYIVLGEINY